MRTPTREEVLDAAAEIVAGFAATDGPRYFSRFAPSATFVFHTEPRRLDDRAAYERVWDGWIAEGWRVVDTTVRTAEGEESFRERETIVFAALDERLVAVHEHLSPIG